MNTRETSCLGQGCGSCTVCSLRTENARLAAALGDAAMSLEAVSKRALAPDEDYSDGFYDARAYAGSRAGVARAALTAVPMLSLGEPGLVTPGGEETVPTGETPRGESCAHLCAKCRVVGCAWCNVDSGIIAEGKCFSCRGAVSPADASRVPMSSGTGAPRLGTWRCTYGSEFRWRFDGERAPDGERWRTWSPKDKSHYDWEPEAFVDGSLHFEGDASGPAPLNRKETP